MNEMILRLMAWLQKERGQGTAEYVLISAAVVGVVATIVYLALQTALGDAVDTLATKITTAIGSL